MLLSSITPMLRIISHTISIVGYKYEHPFQRLVDDLISYTLSIGKLVWEKSNLPASDVQRQIGNVTGGLRLTQAKWKDKMGAIIDQTTYFRNELFGHLNWEEWKKKRFSSEKAKTTFDVYILGESYGLFELEISHKPSGEAGQHNYTTMLHWGELSETVRELNLVSKTFRLYEPIEGQTEPFTVEIT